MPQIGKRLKPKEGVEPQVGDEVTWELIFDDGQKGTITTVVTEFDRL